MTNIEKWLEGISGKNWIWYAKRLSANDTGATESHQSGIYIPKSILWSIFPKMKNGSNPDAWFESKIYPYGKTRNLRAIWYNQGTRNESRITQWNTPDRVMDPDLTGGLVLFAFYKESSEENAQDASIWFCQSPEEESLIEDRLGVILPGEGMLHHPDGYLELAETPPLHDVNKCSIQNSDIPADWLLEFPSGQKIIEFSLLRMPGLFENTDTRLIKRRECETALFYAIEKSFVLPKIEGGFKTVDEFVDLANSITNRRKSRAGKSLELHLKEIFIEEKLSFAHGETSEGNKRPDFLFPSIEAYKDPSWPSKNLRMLASKTTCKDRWRQILNEADRIPTKHLITLQQGVSINQFTEMKAANVMLVVPESLHASYPKDVRPELLSLEKFISQTKAISQS